MIAGAATKPVGPGLVARRRGCSARRRSRRFRPWGRTGRRGPRRRGSVRPPRRRRRRPATTPAAISPRKRVLSLATRSLYPPQGRAHGGVRRRFVRAVLSATRSGQLLGGPLRPARGLAFGALRLGELLAPRSRLASPRRDALEPRPPRGRALDPAGSRFPRGRCSPTARRSARGAAGAGARDPHSQDLEPAEGPRGGAPARRARRRRRRLPARGREPPRRPRAAGRPCEPGSGAASRRSREARPTHPGCHGLAVGHRSPGRRTGIRSPRGRSAAAWRRSSGRAARARHRAPAPRERTTASPSAAC